MAGMVGKVFPVGSLYLEGMQGIQEEQSAISKCKGVHRLRESVILEFL
jgi:hypothetical protein